MFSFVFGLLLLIGIIAVINFILDTILAIKTLKYNAFIEFVKLREKSKCDCEKDKNGK